jgi:predicted Zn-dependent peptidase
MKRWRRCFVVALIAMPAAEAFGLNDIVAFDVPGGLRALVAETNARVSEVVVSVEAGTQHERPDQQGAATTVAEAMLAGELGGQNIRRLLALKGVTSDVTVGSRTTTFRFVLPESQMLGFVPLVAGLFTRDALPESSWAEARQYRSASLDREHANPWLCGSWLFARLVWDSAASAPALARPASEPPVEALEQFRRAHYTRARTVLAIIGTNAIAVRQAITRAFTAGGPIPTSPPPGAPATPVPRAGPVTRYIPAAGSPFLTVGHSVTVRNNDDFFATQILAEVLGGSLSSRLYQRLRLREQLVYTVEASVTPVGSSHLVLQIICQTGDPSRTLRIVQRELTTLATRPVARGELATAVAILRSRLLLDQFSTRESLYRRITHSSLEVVRGPEDGFALLDAITPDALLILARRLLRPQALIAIVGSDAAACRRTEEQGCQLCR